jgi:DNA polymerase-3 subunit alpha
MDDKLNKWVVDNKLIVSESKIGSSDTIIIEGFGTFLYLKPGEDNKIIDGDFSFILSDEEYDILDENKVDYILFEFGGKFYYSGKKQDKNMYNELIYQPEFNDLKYIGQCSEPFIMDFANIGIHDEYEMLSGSGSCDLWCKKAKFLGHKAIGVCDMNSLASSLSFQTCADKYGLKSIIGETISVARNYDEDEEIQEIFELKLYVINQEGWHNLLMISKSINVDYNGFIPAEELYTYGRGLACVVPKNSEINYLMSNNKYDEAKKIISKYKKYFDAVYYQIDTVEFESKQLFREHLNNIDNYILKLCKILKPILINDSYYLDAEEQPLNGMLHKISGKAAPEAKDQYFKSVSDTIHAYDEWIEDVEPLFQTIISAINNLNSFIENVDFRINNSERKIPRFEVDNPEEMFFDELNKGINNKLIGKVDDINKYMERIKIECDLIVPNDLCSYFLILWDICNWCREKDIMIGPGRGSVCGSLVAYCLNITSVDPLKYQLYFERFLNVSRVKAHHSFKLTLEDGREVKYRDGDKVRLVGGDVIEASSNVDWKSLDIEV